MAIAYESVKDGLVEKGFTCTELDALGRFTKLIGEEHEVLDVTGEGAPFSFSEHQTAILRDARIPLPEFPLYHFELDEVIQIKVEIRRLKTKVRGIVVLTRNGVEHGIRHEVEGEAQLWKEIKGAQDAGNSLLAFQVTTFKSEVAEVEGSIDEIFQQYKYNCLKLANYVDDYLHRSPALEQAALVNVIREEIVKDGNPAREMYSTYRPEYDAATNTLLLKEGHVDGFFHANSNMSIHEAGAIVITLQVTVKVRSKGDKYKSSARAYYFFPEAGRFYRANANIVKELGPIDKWDRSYFMGYEQETTKEYNYCFVCGDKLHYPSIPEKIGGAWVNLLKPCCRCFARGSKDPAVFERALNKVITRIKAKKSSDERTDRLRELLGIDA